MTITYKEIKSRQINDLNSKTSIYHVYRKFSTPFTYFFVKLGISPSNISILNFFPNLIGYIFLSKGTYFSIFTGLLFFILYKILDCSDGEVARIQDPNAMDPAHKVREGEYLDAISHFIEPIFLGMGLGVGLYFLYNSEIYITLGVILAVLFTLEYAIAELLRSYFREGIIERKIQLKSELKYTQHQLIIKINEGRSWQKQNIFLRLFGIYPFEGLFFTRQFIVPVLMLVLIVEYYTLIYFNLPIHFYGQAVGFLSIYLFAVMIIKLIKVTSIIFKLKNNKYITRYLDELQ